VSGLSAITNNLYIQQMRSFNKYWDKYGLLVQKDGDGGDTLNRMGHWAIGKYICGSDVSRYFSYKVNRYLHNGDGVYRRHPDPEMWYSDWDRATRDQLTPLVIALGLIGDTLLLKGLRRQMFKNFFMTVRLWPRNVWKDKDEHNRKAARWRPWSDATFRDVLISHLALHIRAGRYWYCYPLLLIMDLELLGGAIIKTAFGRFNKKVRGGDDLNYAARVFQAKEIYPTPFSYLARKVYKRRPHLRDINTKYSELKLDYETESGPQSAFQYYCSKKEYACPPLDLLYKPFLEAL